MDEYLKDYNGDTYEKSKIDSLEDRDRTIKVPLAIKRELDKNQLWNFFLETITNSSYLIDYFYKHDSERLKSSYVTDLNANLEQLDKQLNMKAHTIQYSVLSFVVNNLFKLLKCSNMLIDYCEFDTSFKFTIDLEKLKHHITNMILKLNNGWI